MWFEKERIEIAYDAANWLTGNSSNPAETITATNVTAVGTALAPNRLYVAELRVTGAVTGTVPTLDLTIQASATGSSNWSTLATFPQQTTTMGGLTGPESTTQATQAAVVKRAFRVTAEQPFVRLGRTVSGGSTAPSFSGVTVLVLPAETPTNV